jgi:nucleotide-binding universal stress UspA family protein
LLGSTISHGWLCVSDADGDFLNSVYQRGVTFDTFDNRDASDFSFTLNYKHKDYACTRRSRTFLCAADQNDYSDFALEWLIDELVDDGDEVVCLRVVEKDSLSEEGQYRAEAEKLLEQVIHKNDQDENAISLVIELAMGKVQRIIQRMVTSLHSYLSTSPSLIGLEIHIYEPALLIVGNSGRGLSGMQSLLPGSITKYCLQQSPIPVIVVRPSPKREKKKQKRLADPSRRSYTNILALSEQRGSGLFDNSISTDGGSVANLPDEEAAAVAEAVGLPLIYQGRARAQSDSKLLTPQGRSYNKSSESHGSEPSRNRIQNTTIESLDAIILRSPMPGNLGSSSLSGVGSGGDNGDSGVIPQPEESVAAGFEPGTSAEASAIQSSKVIESSSTPKNPCQTTVTATSRSLTEGILKAHDTDHG